MKKLLSVLLVLVLAIGLVAVPVSANEVADPTLEIANFSFSLNNAFDMNIKVNSDIAQEDVQILLWTAAPSEYVKGDEDVCIKASNLEETQYVFRYTGIAAKKLADTVYFCAYANVGGTEYYSAPAKYSFVEYANTLINESTDEDLVYLLENALAYGATAQTYFGYNAQFPADSALVKVTVVDGTLADGFTVGYFLEGQQVVITALDSKDGYGFDGWTTDLDTSSASKKVIFNAEEDVTYTANFGGFAIEEGVVVDYKVGAPKTRLVVPAEATGFAAGVLDEVAIEEISFASATTEIAEGAIPADVTINGYADSTAAAYATANGNTFVEIPEIGYLPLNNAGETNIAMPGVNEVHTPHYTDKNNHNYNWFNGGYKNGIRYYASMYTSAWNKKSFVTLHYKFQETTNWTAVNTDFSAYGAIEIEYQVVKPSDFEGKTVTATFTGASTQKVTATLENLESMEWYTLSIPFTGLDMSAVGFFNFDFNANFFHSNCNGQLKTDPETGAVTGYDSWSVLDVPRFTEEDNGGYRFAIRSVNLIPELLIEA